MNGWIQLTTCPNCHGSDLQPYETVTTAPYFEVMFCGGSLPVLTHSVFVRCDSCGLVMQSPRMTDERIAEYYSSGAYRQTLGVSVEYMDADEQRRADNISSWLWIQEVAPKRHLDIGCSRGYLLESVVANVQHGFDSNPAYSNDIQVFSDKSKLQQYDLVTAVHVLEHTTDPIAELQWYKSLSTDKVLIEVPGANCKGGPLRFAHLFYFPFETLHSMVEAAGMKVVAVETNPNTRILATVKG